MKNVKRLLELSLFLLMIPGVSLMGCSRKPSGSSKSSSTSQSSSSSSSSSDKQSSSSSSPSSDSSSSEPSEFPLTLNVKNLYFDTWSGDDTYTKYIEDKFGIRIKASNYDYSSWDEMVYMSVNGDNLPDTFHFNLNSLNIGNSYRRWAKENILKPLPDDMSRWPHIERMLSQTSNIEQLKINGKLYGIPISNDISNQDIDFSNFTYVYRRDWVKQIDEMYKNNSGYESVYREGDVYTWEEFNRLVAALQANMQAVSGTDRATVLADEPWAFPSLTNFFKDSPKCFTKDDKGFAINAFTSDKYITGLEVSKNFITNGFYSSDQYSFVDGKVKNMFVGGLAGILYDNCSLSNYISLRKSVQKNNRNANLDDATALLKIKDQNGQFALEGAENWFSMTLFNSRISDRKQEKTLDLLDFLLSEEGTRLAIYGLEGYDYLIEDGEVVLVDEAWEKDVDGHYAPKENGAKYLRYMVTLGNDTKAFDPYTDMDTYAILNNWSQEMKAAKNNGQLRTIKEPADIEWMSTRTKDDRNAYLLTDAKQIVAKYCFGRISDIESYKAEFGKDPCWQQILVEINEKLGKS